MKKISKILFALIVLTVAGIRSAPYAFAEGIVDYCDKYREYLNTGDGNMSVTEFLTGESETDDSSYDAAREKRKVPCGWSPQGFAEPVVKAMPHNSE